MPEMDRIRVMVWEITVLPGLKDSALQSYRAAWGVLAMAYPGVHDRLLNHSPNCSDHSGSQLLQGHRCTKGCS
jgi:hypothetical protein